MLQNNNTDIGPENILQVYYMLTTCLMFWVLLCYSRYIFPSQICVGHRRC